MMVKAKYEDTANHKQIHNDFLAKIKSLKAPLDAASVDWAKQWWVSSLFILCVFMIVILVTWLFFLNKEYTI